MTKNQEADADIQMVVDDFKQKYEHEATATPTQTTTAQPKKPNIFQRAGDFMAKDVFGQIQDSQLPEDGLDSVGAGLFQATLGSKGLAGIAQLPGRVLGEKGRIKDETALSEAISSEANNTANLQKLLQKETDPVRKAKLQKIVSENTAQREQIMGVQKGLSEMSATPEKALGTTANAALTAISFAKPSLFGTSLKGSSAYVSALSGGYQVADNLLRGEAPNKGVPSAMFIGALMPGAFRMSGKVLSTPMNLLTQKLPSKMINTLIRPPEKAFRFSRNPGLTVAREGIVGNNLDDLSRGISSRISEHMGKLETAVKNNYDIVDGSDILPVINQFKSKAISLGAEGQPLVNRLQNLQDLITHTFKLTKDDIITKGAPRDLTKLKLTDVLAIKRLVGEGTQWTGQAFDKSVNQARVKVYYMLDDIIDKKLGSLGDLTAKELNGRVSSLIDAKSSIVKAIANTERRNLFGLSQKFIGGGTALLVADDILKGDWDSAGKKLAYAAALIAGSKGAASVRVRSEIARATAQGGDKIFQFLRSLSPYQRGSILESTPVLKNYYQMMTGKNPVPGVLKNIRPGMNIQVVGDKSIPAILNNAKAHVLENARYAAKNGRGISEPTLKQIELALEKNYANVVDLEKAVLNASKGAQEGAVKTLLGHVNDAKMYIQNFGL